MIVFDGIHPVFKHSPPSRFRSIKATFAPCVAAPRAASSPRTFKQERWRARFRAASSKYSQSLTEEQRDACIAEGAKLRSRSRMRQLGPLTGQQYSIRKEYAANPAARMQKAPATSKMLQPQRVARKYRSEEHTSELQSLRHL